MTYRYICIIMSEQTGTLKKLVCLYTPKNCLLNILIWQIYYRIVQCCLSLAVIQ